MNGKPMTKHVAYSTDTTLVGVTNETINFGGIPGGKTLAFGYFCYDDAVTVSGFNETIRIARAGGIFIVDNSHGLTIDLNAPANGVVVQDFQNDATGKVALSYLPSSAAFASDHHGGTMLTA